MQNCVEMSYGSVHSFLLRSIASRGVLSTIEAENVVKSVTDDEVSVPQIVKTINDEIRPFQQTIKVVNDEVTDEKLLIFLSLGFDEATKAQNLFSASELEFFRLLIEEIMSTDNRQLTGIHAINLVGKMKGSFNKTDAQKLLNTWCRMYYLEKDGSNYALGVRAIHEFESYLRQNMPDTIEECCLCKQIVFRGCNCPACGLAVHTRCLNTYLEKVEKWPCCKADYSASQLERFNSDRLSPTQRVADNDSEVDDTAAEPAADLTTDTMAEESGLSQDTMAGISQSATRKRKRQRE